MTSETPKVEFALGSEVSPGRFFKSAFARNFISSGRDCKSLDYELLDNVERNEDDRNNNGRNNNFFSLVNFADGRPANGDDAARTTTFWEQPKPKEAAQPAADANELEKLRKQCQSLKKENRRLQSAFLQNVFLQARVDTLQWQVKQVESNRQMYRSTMEQVAHFLGRAHRSLEILHAKENSKDKRRVPRSRSVHTVMHADPSPSRGNATPSSSSTSSPFTRAKSVTQISSPSPTCFREFTWSVLRRNDPVHCTTPRVKPPLDLSKTNDVPDNVVYREPKQTELNPDEIPPEKLSQEAFRLLRTVESLLSMREPDLARMTPVEENGSPSPTVDHHRHHDTSFSLSSSNFANSTTLQEATVSSGCSNSSRGNESSSGHQDDSRSSSLVKTSVIEFTRNLQSFVPNVRRSPDTASWNSSSSKTTEEEDILALAASSNGVTSNGTPISTLSRATKRLEKKESTGLAGKPKVKPASSPVSSAEGESGFFSISSFQEVGLPASATLSITPMKGCHTEVGLPEVPLDKTRHRRWSSTPAEIQALFKQHRASIGGMPQTTTESVSVCWV
ncbi:PREDICTED: uncharacterized protein LOC105149593 [Acromyrmex echinatior]|nr:PREDICTED: uncharacterized protein LOC105149593 [Acromyrmex echinatior]